MDRFGDKLSRVGASVEGSETLAVTALAKRLQAEGKDVISLTAGEPDFQSPEVVKAAGIAAIREGATRYTAAAGEPLLRQRIAAAYAERLGLEIGPGQVCVSSGAKPLIYYLMCILLDRGDEVLFPVPYWVSYEAMVRMREGVARPVATRLEDDHKLTAAALEAAITPKSKVLLLNNPTNPTGVVYTKAELGAIAEVVRDRDLLVIADEIYESLVYGDAVHQSLYNLAPWSPERTVLISGFSKSYSMTGWRLGFAIGPEGLIETLANYQSQALSSPSQISQRAGLAALAEAGPDVATMRDAFERRLGLCLGRMETLGLTFIRPRGAFYLFFDAGPVLAARGWADGKEFCTHLLEEAGLALVPGTAFGMPRWVRLSFAASDEDLTSAFDRLQKFCA